MNRLAWKTQETTDNSRAMTVCFCILKLESSIMPENFTIIHQIHTFLYNRWYGTETGNWVTKTRKWSVIIFHIIKATLTPQGSHSTAAHSSKICWFLFWIINFYFSLELLPERSKDRHALVWSSISKSRPCFAICRQKLFINQNTNIHYYQHYWVL